MYNIFQQNMSGGGGKRFTLSPLDDSTPPRLHGGSATSPIVVDEVDLVASKLVRCNAVQPSQAAAMEDEDLYSTIDDAQLHEWLKEQGFHIPDTNADMLATLQDIREDMLGTLEVLEDKLESLLPRPEQTKRARITP